MWLVTGPVQEGGGVGQSMPGGISLNQSSSFLSLSDVRTSQRPTDAQGGGEATVSPMPSFLSCA